MRVGIVTSSLDPQCGMGNFSLNMAIHLNKLAQVKVAVSEESRGNEFIVEKLLSPVHRKTIIGVMRDVSRVAGFMQDCDAVHCIDENYILAAALAARFQGKPYFLHSIGTYSILPFNKLLQKHVYRILFRGAKKVICISNFTRSELLKRVALKNTEVIFPGIADDYFHEQGRVQTTSGKEELIILSVGAVKGRKGYDISISAFAKVKHKTGANMKYYIIGEEGSREFRQNLNSIIEEHKLEQDVIFLGKVSDEELKNWYQKCDIFILTPRVTENNFEGFGLVFLEAAANRKAVIASSSGGVVDAVENGVTGIIIPENDVNATADALEELIGDGEKRLLLGAHGYERAKRFSWENCAHRIVELYKE